MWRRSYDVPPPTMARDDERNVRHDPRYAWLPSEVVPDTECLADVVERNEARAAGEFGDTPAEVLEPQFFVVTDEHDIIEVAAKLGLPDHSELGAINGQANLVRGVQRGQRLVLPAHYRFDGIEGVYTESELAGTEPSA